MADQGAARQDLAARAAEGEPFETEEAPDALTEREILAQLARVEARARAAGAAGPIAIAASYDPRAGRIVITLEGGRAEIAVSPAVVPALAHATPRDLAEIEVYPSGKALRWPRLDVDVSVPAVVREALGEAALAGLFAAAGGRSRSAAKAEAARANGRKGGRPPNKTGAARGSRR